MKLNIKLDRQKLTGVDDREDSDVFLEWVHIIFEQLSSPASFIEHALVHGIQQKVRSSKGGEVMLCPYEYQFLVHIFTAARIPPAANSAFCQYLERLGIKWDYSGI